ncbi:hypothetical protein JRO89_XS03G0285000 [Xanthoceras sorbifolium]|uniref:F-box/LRR-repeat protein 15-like leucin rich repeat domain-containing protein n=1 Tax=Xanthoceras sorbifolium TaxID=99658 RepID=A0ABQ8IDM9_9ROSI|nr:hypothetical protein JRO89_XS03G0285000 [Xanthoceras sorbifolium]
MGGICSRKRDQQVVEDVVQRGVSGRYFKSASSKWLRTSFSRPLMETKPGGGSCPSLMELCIYKIRQDINKYTSFSMLPRDISQQIFNELVFSHSLTDVSLEAFRDCALQDILLGEYPAVNDSWMDVIASQGSSLLCIDLSGSDVTDTGLGLLKDCSNLQALTFNFSDHISERGLKHISGLTNLTSLSLKKSNVITAEAMHAFSSLVNLEKLDMERCSGIHGGFGHLKGLMKLEFLNIRCCKCITDSDMKALSVDITYGHTWTWSCGLAEFYLLAGSGPGKFLCHSLQKCSLGNEGPVLALGPSEIWHDVSCLSGLANVFGLSSPLVLGLTMLKELQVSNCNITDLGVSYLRGLGKLIMLNLEGCNVTAACLDYISGYIDLERSLNCHDNLNIGDATLVALAYLNLNRCSISDDGCDKFSGLKNLKILSLGFNNITDACLVHLKGSLSLCLSVSLYLTNLESLNLDSCNIGDEGLANLRGLTLLKSLELSDTEVGSGGLCHLSGLTRLENLNLSFTSVTDSGLKKLAGLTSLKSLNLDARNVTDVGLAALTSLTGLTHLDLFGAHISDSGTNSLRCFKNLQSLEICGGILTDVGVKNIKDLTSLTFLNLSQNCSLSDKSLELISGLTSLVSLNVSNSRITNEGLHYLKPLKRLCSLTLESCKVTASEIKKLQSTALPNLVNYRPE